MMKKSAVISLLFMAVTMTNNEANAFKLQQSQTQGLTSHTHQKTRDDDDENGEAPKKVDEVEALMQKYDNEEKEIAYKKSPEYKQELEKKKMKEI